MFKRKYVVAMGLSLAAMLAMAGCGGSSDPAASPSGTAGDKGEAVTLRVEGSTSVDPLMQIFKDKYNVAHPNVTIEITANGSGNGISAAQKGTTDIGMSSRKLKDDETGLVPTTIAHDGIAVIVSKDNPVNALTTDQIAKIYKGEIKNWKEVGGNDAEINLVIREASSGTRGAFEELLGLEGENGTLVDEKNAAVMDATSGVIQTVKANANAIGYVSFGSMGDDVKAVQVDGVTCSAETVKDGSYKIARPFLLITKEGANNADAQAFIDWILSDEGQTIVTDEKYVTVK